MRFITPVLAVGLMLSGCAAPKLSPALRANEVALIVANEAEKQGVRPALAVAVAQYESKFDPFALSPSGAVGVMQIMPSTWRWMNCTGFITDAQANARCGLTYFAQGLRVGGEAYALARYHAGPGGARKPAARRYAAQVMARVR
jgi:soluble lytic murein transglycosylase-like protein